MHILKTKKTIIRYVNTFEPPQLLIDQNHPAISFIITVNNKYKWQWVENYLMSLSIKQLVDLCLYLENYYNVDNQVSAQ